jgi:spermidine/putrescine transport system permease protein
MSQQALATRSGRRLLALHTLAVFGFLYAPLLVLIVFSFNQAKQTAVWEGFTLDWYRALVGDKSIHEAVMNSLKVATLTTLLATLIGVPAGLALGRYRFRGKLATQALVYLPLIIPEIVFAAAAVTLFGLLRWRLGLTTVVLSHLVFCVSYVAIIVRARLETMDPTLEQAAADLGAGPLSAFCRVTLPLMLPAIIAGAILSFTVSLDDYLVASFVAGPGATTLPLRIYSMLKTGITPEVNAVSTVVLVGTAALLLIAQWLLGASFRKEILA